MLDALNRLSLKLDPSLILDAIGIVEPDDYQRRVLRSTAERVLINVHRQAGKTTAVSALATWTALFDPGSLSLLVSASQRQADELFRKTVAAFDALGRPVATVEDSARTLALATGSRVVSLPANAATVRGFSAPRLVLIDEAAQVPDEMFASILPMLAVSRGRLVLLSTPFGQRGFFHSAWTSTDAAWEKVQLKAIDNLRIDPGWLEEQRMILGDRWFSQEFLCSFEATLDQTFATEAVLGAFTSAEPPLFAESFP